MVLSILSSLILVDQKRRLVQLFQESVRKQWNIWEPRGLVLISLALQTSLIYSGNRRKYIAKRWIRAFIWSAYLLADWIATVALGILVDRSSSDSGNSNDGQYGDLRLMAFWAPFLLLHLGGPDTITAYALADNELWLRHFLGVVVQTAAAIYITLLTWDGTVLSFLTIPMLLCGMIKYGERTWVLMSADLKNLQDSFLGVSHAAEANYTRFMEEFSLKEAEGYHVTATQMKEGISPQDYTPTISLPDASILQTADYFFETLKFKHLLVDLVLSFNERDLSRSFFQRQNSKNIAFQVIEYELGFAYDVFYTKAPIIYTPFGLFFRLFTFIITLSVLLTFFLSIGLKSHNHQFVDVVITYVLLIGAILLDSYAAFSSLNSDWATLWFSKHSSKIPSVSHSSDRSLQSAQKEKRWSHSMYQYGLLDFCLTQKSSAFYKISSFIPLGKRLRNLWVKYWVSFRHLKHLEMSPDPDLELSPDPDLESTPDPDLKSSPDPDLESSPDLESFIFKHFLKKSTGLEFSGKNLSTDPGTVALKSYQRYDDLKWTVEVEFDHSILIWHIATDICYNREENKQPKMQYSKQLSEYMLYLLVKCPFMLPIGIGMIRFQDTCNQVLAFLEEKSWESEAEAYQFLGLVSSNYSPGTLKVSESVLFDACNLAAKLKKMNEPGRMWEMVSDVWVEILGYAAGQCNGFDHAQQLHKGGELLTHVWLLMAHLGLTKQFKEESHGRVKLVTA